MSRKARLKAMAPKDHPAGPIGRKGEYQRRQLGAVLKGARPELPRHQGLAQPPGLSLDLEMEHDMGDWIAGKLGKFADGLIWGLGIGLGLKLMGVNIVATYMGG